MTTPALSVEQLTAGVHQRQILTGVDLEVPFGEVHAIMGPNGSGKSTLCHVLTGKEGFDVTGSASLDGDDLFGLTVPERAERGLLQAFQYPVEVPGVSLGEFLREVGEARSIDRDDMDQRIDRESARFDMDRFLDRSLNDELSGGEKKRSEIFQLAVLGARVAVLDEIDSGLDIDAVREVAAAVEQMRGPDLGVVMITHYSRILRYITPDRVHVMVDGRIVEFGGPELAEQLEQEGYEGVRSRLGIPAPVTTPEVRPADLLTDTPFDIA
jgi:Fe-S cluster assembly ATP-binding protein